jgi:hypothetical protein
MQQALKPTSGAARAEVVAAEFFAQLDIAMDDAPSTLDMGFRGEGLPPLTRDAERRGRFSKSRCLRMAYLHWVKRGPSPRGVTITGLVIREATSPTLKSERRKPEGKIHRRKRRDNTEPMIAEEPTAERCSLSKQWTI